MPVEDRQVDIRRRDYGCWSVERKEGYSISLGEFWSCSCTLEWRILQIESISPVSTCLFKYIEYQAIEHWEEKDPVKKVITNRKVRL